MAERKVQALLVTSPASVRYLTGYSGSNGLVLLTPSEAHFFTDPRYALDAAQNITCQVHVARKPLLDEAAGIIKRKRLKTIGFEPSWLHVDQFRRLEEQIPLGVTLEPVDGLVEELRLVKSSDEIERIRRSVLLNSDAYARTLRGVRPGVRERDVAAELDFQMHRLGAEKTAFDTIVAAGTRSALPHAQPTAHRLAPNELLLIDMGACLDGYMSDMTRVCFMGVPPQRVRRLYRAVADAQLAALDAVRPGATTVTVDRAARLVLKGHNLEKEFVHSTGHGLGLEIHEAPRIGRRMPKSKGAPKPNGVPAPPVAKPDQPKLRAGMVITIEPGAYIEGLGGVRIEDTVLVTANGCEVLTPTSKEFVNL